MQAAGYSLDVLPARACANRVDSTPRDRGRARRGRTTRTQRSEYDRPETIEETAGLVDRVGWRGIAIRVDHLEPAQAEALIACIEDEQGRLDVLVNDV